MPARPAVPAIPKFIGAGTGFQTKLDAAVLDTGSVVAISGGGFLGTVAFLKDNGKVITVTSTGSSGAVVWDSTVLGDVVAVDAGGSSRFIVLRSNRTVATGKSSDNTLLAVPPTLTDVVAVAADKDSGSYFASLQSDGTVKVWSSDSSSSTLLPVPAGATGVVGIALSGASAAALLSTGQVLVWTVATGALQPGVPAQVTDIVAISAGGTSGSEFFLALKSDGKVFAWGNNSKGQINVPADLPAAVGVSAGYTHSMALLPDGQIKVWGSTTQATTSIPFAGRALAVTSGDFYGALVQGQPPFPTSGRIFAGTFRGVYGLSTGSGTFGSIVLTVSSNWAYTGQELAINSTAPTTFTGFFNQLGQSTATGLALNLSVLDQNNIVGTLGGKVFYLIRELGPKVPNPPITGQTWNAALSPSSDGAYAFVGNGFLVGKFLARGAVNWTASLPDGSSAVFSGKMLSQDGTVMQVQPYMVVQASPTFKGTNTYTSYLIGSFQILPSYGAGGVAASAYIWRGLIEWISSNSLIAQGSNLDAILNTKEALPWTPVKAGINPLTGLPLDSNFDLQAGYDPVAQTWLTSQGGILSPSSKVTWASSVKPATIAINRSTGLVTGSFSANIVQQAAAPYRALLVGTKGAYGYFRWELPKLKKVSQGNVQLIPR